MGIYNILDFMDSLDIRDYHKNTEFTPAQQAVLIAWSEKATVEEKIKALESILRKYMVHELKSDTVHDSCGRKTEAYRFRQVLMENIEIWKEILQLRDSDTGAVYAVQLVEKDDFHAERILYGFRFYSCYKKAYQYLLEEKQNYIKDSDLTNIETFGEIYRILLDDMERDYTDSDRFKFDNDMRLVRVLGSSKRCSNENEAVCLLEEYGFYIPLPFQKGDKVKAESPFYQTRTGIFSNDWKDIIGQDEFIATIVYGDSSDSDPWEAGNFDHVNVLHLRKMEGEAHEENDNRPLSGL